MTNFNREDENNKALSSNHEQNVSQSETELNKDDSSLPKESKTLIQVDGEQTHTNAQTMEEEEKPKVIREIEVLEEYEEKTAGFWIRFWAFLIDTMPVSAIIGILVNPIFLLMDWNLHSTEWYAPITIISGVFYYTYFVVTTKLWQQTVGKMIFGLKVISTEDKKLTWGTILFRETVSRFICNKIPIVYIMVAFTPKNKGLQDYIADTIVIQEKVFVKNKKEIIKEQLVDEEVIQPMA